MNYLELREEFLIFEWVQRTILSRCVLIVVEEIGVFLGFEGGNPGGLDLVILESLEIDSIEKYMVLNRLAILVNLRHKLLIFWSILD